MNNQLDKTKDSSKDGSNSPCKSELIIESTDLLQGRRIVVIKHKGERYRLIETRNGKLILQK